MLSPKLIGALLLLASAVGLALVGQPSAKDRLAAQRPALEQRLAASEARIDPGELFDLTQNNQVRLVLYDLRSETDYNLFHLDDAVNISLDALARLDLNTLPPDAVIVVMSNDEQAAEQGWMLLAAQGRSNAYLLGGGVNFWLSVYRDENFDAPLPPRGAGDDKLRHHFGVALGAAQDAAHPNPFHTPKRTYTVKVQAAAAAKRPGGGCG